MLRIAARAGAFVIEDDFARYLVHEGDTPRPLILDDDDGRVVYVTSLTKAAAPSMRVGALVARGPVAERVRALHVVDSFFVPRFLQEAALEFVAGPAWHRHLRTLQQLLRKRRQVLVTALASSAPDVEIAPGSHGGMHAGPVFPTTSTSATSRRPAAARASWSAPAGRTSPPSRPAVISGSSFAGVANSGDLEVAVERIAQALTAVRGRGAPS